MAQVQLTNIIFNREIFNLIFFFPLKSTIIILILKCSFYFTYCTASPYFIWLHVLSSQSKLTKDNGAVYGQSYGMGHLLARATGLGNNVTDQQYTPPSFPASASAPVLHPQHPQYNQDVQPDMQPPPYNPAFQQQTSGDLYPMIVK